MIFGACVIQDGLVIYVIWILTIALQISPAMDHAIVLEQLLVLIEILLIHVSVPMALLATTAQKTSMNVKTIPVEMVETVPIMLVTLNVLVLRDILELPVVSISPHVNLSHVAMEKAVSMKEWGFTLVIVISVLLSVHSLRLVTTQ